MSVHEEINGAISDHRWIMDSGNFAHICFMYLDSRAYRNETVVWIEERWKDKSNSFILDDLLSTHRFDTAILNLHDATALSLMIERNGISLIPIGVFDSIPEDCFEEEVLYYPNNDFARRKLITLKEYLLIKRIPAEYKDIIRRKRNDIN